MDKIEKFKKMMEARENLEADKMLENYGRIKKKLDKKKKKNYALGSVLSGAVL